jgi:enamine deaminase RidA (YjgF/YER057c/UK114 family)
MIQLISPSMMAHLGGLTCTGRVSPGNTPGRACVEARLAAPHWKVEIAVVAARE